MPKIRAIKKFKLTEKGKRLAKILLISHKTCFSCGKQAKCVDFNDEGTYEIYFCEFCKRFFTIWTMDKGYCYQKVYCNECLAFPMGLGCPNNIKII